MSVNYNNGCLQGVVQRPGLIWVCQSRLSLITSLVMARCTLFFEELVECLLASDCVQKQGRSVKECLDRKYDESVPEECRNRQQLYRECRFNMVGLIT